MAWGDDWLKNGLPQFAGGKNKAVARTLVDGIGGPEGFRKVVRTLPDGSTMMVTLRGNMSPLVQMSQKVVEALVDFVEESYSLRVITNSGYDYMRWMTQTPLLDNKLLKVRVISRRESYEVWWDENAVFWPIEPNFLSPDGMFRIYMLRHVKSATITIDGVDKTVTFAYSPVRTEYDDQHTVEVALGIFARVKPTKDIKLTLEGATRTLQFKPPPSTIVCDGTLPEGVNPFDTIVAYGGLWHGRYTEDGLITPDGMLHPEFTAPAYPNFTYYLKYNCPALPPVPATNAAEMAAGLRWYDDVVLCGRIARWYSPMGGAVGLTWPYLDPTGAMHSLNISYSNITRLASVYEFLTNDSGATVQVFLLTDIHVEVSPAHQAYYNASVAYGVPESPDYGEATAIRVSPDGTKCLFTPEGSAVYMAIEFEASGGGVGTGVARAATVTWRHVTEAEPLYVYSRSETGRPPDGAFSSWLLTSYDHEVTHTRKYPTHYNYDKDSNLIVDWMMFYEHSRTLYSAGTAPYWYSSAYLAEVTRQTTSLSGNEIVLYQHTVDGGSFSQIAPLTISHPPGLPSACGYYIVLSDGSYVSADPWWPGDSSLWKDQSTPNAETRTATHVVTRHTDTLSSVTRYAGPPSTYTVTEAYAYGEAVTALIGHVFASSPTSEKVAYNPRTGEVAFGDFAGFI